jgi:hypothetical protein
MDFFINKNSTLPVLKLELVKDGRNDYKKFHELIQNSNIFFSMSEVETGIKKIGRKPALCFVKEPTSDCNTEEYYLGYQFSAKETKKAGRYAGQFEIVFLDGSGTLIVPVREELYINILGGSIKK